MALRERGHPVRAHDLDAAREAMALSQGATVHADAMSVARGSAALIVAVVDAGQVRDVLFGARGAAHGLVLGAAVPDHCAAELAAHGVDCIDAPMSGGPARVMARCA